MSGSNINDTTEPDSPSGETVDKANQTTISGATSTGTADPPSHQLNPEQTEQTPDEHERLRFHRRLRRVVTIAFLGFCFFFFKNLIDGNYAGKPIGLCFHGICTVATFLIAIILFFRSQASLSQLRLLEVALLVAGAAFFGWFQFDSFQEVVLFTQLDDNRLRSVISNTSDACMLRWFAMIVLYGISVPNDLRRCCISIALIALVPLFATILAGISDNTLKYFGDALVEMLTWLAIASFVAIYGSYRIQVQWRAAMTPGRRLGQYRVIQSLGKGAMGEVLLAERPLLRRRCAIKKIRAEEIMNPIMARRFEREVQATARLTHWNNVRILDYGQDDDGTFFYVMDYLEGLDLQALVNRYGPLPAARVVHFLAQLCNSLHEAHSIALIHRDIKPSNIMVCKRGANHDVVVLLDYGIVKLVQFDVQADITENSLVGTPAFMSPEQASGQHLDSRSDLYSLGAVAYFLLTGVPPFVRPNGLQVIQAHITTRPVDPVKIRDSIPPDLNQVVMKCLEKKPNDRYVNIAALKKALNSCSCSRAWSDEEADEWWKTNLVLIAP